jgi:hypothetical protein
MAVRLQTKNLLCSKNFAARKQNNSPNEIQLHVLRRPPFDPPASPILKSSILRPVFMAATNQRGCFPRPDHVSDGV